MASVNLAAIPACPILVPECDKLAVGVNTGVPPGVLQEHEREQPGRLGLVRHELHERPAQTDRLRAEALAQRLGAGRGRVPFIEQ